MLISGVLKFDSLGRVIISSLPTETFNGGTPIAADGGLSAAIGAIPESFIGGIGYTNDNKLCNSDNPLLPPDGVLVNRLGQMTIDTSPPVVWYAGLPITASGRLAISPGDGPVMSGFDDGFDGGFGP